MKLGWITLLTLIVCGISEVRIECAEHCRRDCACCTSAPSGSRSLSNICQNGPGSKCTHGCQDGYYGGKCYSMCPAYCTRCSREFGAINTADYKKCYLCADGYYNGTGVTDCSTPCPVNCEDNQCDKTTGHCLNGCTSKNQTGNKFNCCVSGYYGEQCEPCLVYCKDDMCDVNDGSCTNGCKDSRLTGAKCDQCVTGKYGDNCDKSCPDNCDSDVCDRTEGTCTYGCAGNFAGSKCELCKPMYYGEACENMCSNCLNGQCDRNTGICDDCSIAFYSQYCNTTCSSGCKNGACYRYNATCTQGCQSGYSGDKCCVTNNNCEICDTVSTCSACKTGFYGNSCEQICPEKCVDSCSKLSGKCRSCKIGFYGNTCTHTCPKNCLNVECTQHTGQCISCKIGYHGDSCNKTCTDNCGNKKCDQDGGKCDYCIVGFHGPLCDLDCAQGCINDTCVQVSGVCIYGCKDGYTEECSYKQEIADDNVNVGAIIGGLVGGLSIVIIILVLYIIHLRCRIIGSNENNEAERDNVAEMEEPNTYEGLGGETMTEKSVYSDLHSDVVYVNTEI